MSLSLEETLERTALSCSSHELEIACHMILMIFSAELLVMRVLLPTETPAQHRLKIVRALERLRDDARETFMHFGTRPESPLMFTQAEQGVIETEWDRRTQAPAYAALGFYQASKLVEKPLEKPTKAQLFELCKCGHQRSSHEHDNDECLHTRPLPGCSCRKFEAVK